MAELPNIVRQGLQGQAANGTHIEPNLLAAFSEGALSKAERESVLGHLATCAHCREVAAVAAGETEAAAGRFSIAAAAEQRRFKRVFAWRWSVVAITACLVVGSAVMLRTRTPTQSAEERHVAQVQPQATPSEAGSTSMGKVNTDAAGAGKDRDALAASKRQEPATKAEARRDQLHAPMTMHGKSTPSAPVLTAEAPAAEAKGGVGPMAKKQAVPEPEKERVEAYAKLGHAPSPAAPPSAMTAPAYADGKADKLANNSEALDVTANAAPAPQETQNSGAAGRIASGSGAGISAGSVPARPQPAAVQQQAMARAKTAANPKMIAVNAVPLPLRWTIAADGSLQRSADNGQSWQAVALSEGKPFRAVASVGAVVWAGGSNGVLFRSVDAGEHWTRIHPTSGEQSLTGDVTSLHLDGASNEIVRVQTSTGQKWISNDGGQRWALE